MLMRANAFFACLLCLSVVSAQSVLPDEYVGTARTGADVLYTRGQFAGCSMQFAATVKDTAYERGDIVAVRGSLLFNVFQGAQSKYLMPALRIGVFRINGNGVLTAATPDFVYAHNSPRFLQVFKSCKCRLHAFRMSGPAIRSPLVTSSA